MKGHKEARAFAIMAKPIGSACNLRCTYCYYSDKIFAGNHGKVMSDEVLNAYIVQNLAAHGKMATVEFAWHGGEPTLCGIDFFRRALAFEEKHGSGRSMQNTLQTNGTLLNDEWCQFFRENDFIIGISIDGPKQLHDKYRRDARGGGSFEDVMRGVALLKRYGVRYNTLTTINAANVLFPDEVYAFLSGVSDFMQFLPVVEQARDAMPPGVFSGKFEGKTADYSTGSREYGEFLCRVFDIWRSRDIGEKFVQAFEAVIGNMMGSPAGVCVHEPICGHAASVEADGSLYSCDRYAFDLYKLGNITETPLSAMMENNRKFGMYKADGLAQECIDCHYLGLCWGGCPKDRYATAVGRKNQNRYKNYLCSGYKAFFAHVERRVRIG